MDLENTGSNNENEILCVSMDLNDFAMPSDISSTDSDNSANEGTDSNCDYELLQTTSTIDPIESNIKSEDEMMIMSSLKLSDCDINGSDRGVQSEQVLESTTPIEFDSLECIVSKNVLDDWHMVNQCVEKYDFSDDDSIVILEREFVRPSYALTKIGNQGDIDVQNLEEMTTSLITVDKHVQTNDDVVTNPSLELPTLEPSEAVEQSIPSHESNIHPWIVDCLSAVAVFTSLIFLFYSAAFIFKEFGYLASKPTSDEANDAVMDFMVHVVRDFNARMEELQRNMDYIAETRKHNYDLDSNKPEELKEYLRQDLAAMNTFFDRYREDGKRVFANNKVLYQQIEMLRDNVYILNVHDFIRSCPEQSLLPKSIFKLLSDVERIAPCDASAAVAEDRLPLPCRDHNQKVNLIFHRNHLVSVNLHSEVFYEKVSRRLEGDENAHLGVAAAADNAKESNAAAGTFVQDCDNFSKNYRSNFCTESNSADCSARGGAIEHDETDTHTCSRAKPEPQSVDTVPTANDNLLPTKAGVSPLPSTPKNGVDAESSEAKALKMVHEFKTLIKKFKNEFEHFYTLCMEAEESVAAEQSPSKDNGDAGAETADKADASFSSSANETSTDDVNPSEDAASLSPDDHDEDDDEERTKPISGDWFFNLNEARAELRRYYEKTVSGDWILKLGKAREKLRQRFGEYKRKFMKKVRSSSSSSSSKERKNKTKEGKRWTSTSEHLKDNLKKFSSKWKTQFKRMKDGFVHNYNKYVPSSWQFDANNGWFYS